MLFIKHVFSHQDNPANLARSPRVVVISYTMLQHLRRSILEQEWSLLIVDESHHLRCSKKATESEEINAVLDLATKVKRIVLLSGTPSLSRPFDIFHQINMLWPGLLGKNKYEFAKVYCDLNFVRGPQGKIFQDFSKGIRLEELNVLLKQTVMIRRLKEHVMVQLPPKCRRIVRLLLKRSDIVSARAVVSTDDCDGSCRRFIQMISSENIDEAAESCDCNICSENGRQILGIAKLFGFFEWLSIHPIVSGCDGALYLDSSINSQKMIIFAHHLKVLDRIQEFVSEKGIGFVRIDGNTLPKDRQSSLLSFRTSTEVKIAIIGLLVGAVGVDFSAAQHVVFLELPQNPAIMQQAEDRAHRHGQINTVNIYIFCAKDTSDETHWRRLNKSLHHVSSTTNGKYDALHEIAVQDVSYFERSHTTDANCGPNIENAAKFPNSGLADNELFVEESEKTYSLKSDGFSTHTEITEESTRQPDLHIKTEGVSNFHYENDCSSEAEERSNASIRSSLPALSQCQENCNQLNKVQDVSYLERSHTADANCGPNIENAAKFPNSASADNELFVKESEKTDSLKSDGFSTHTEITEESTRQLDLQTEGVSNFHYENDCFPEAELRSNASVSLFLPALNQCQENCNQLNKLDSGFPNMKEFDNDGPFQHNEVDRIDQAYFLRFEVSQYTGRIHVYSCIPGIDSRPRPLFVNCRPEDLESCVSLATANDKSSFKFIDENPSYRDALLDFINQWNNLRPVEQKKLLRKPLQLPLVVELCYLEDNINHNGRGLLRGGSKRRTTPISDISHPLPTDAIWKKVHLCSGYGKKEKEYTQAWTSMDEPLCKLCQTPCMGNNAKNPAFFEDLFCNLGCYEEFRLRTSNKFLRLELFQIEHGVCSKCQLDCHKLVLHLKPLSMERRQNYIKKVAPNIARHKKLLDKLVSDPSEGNSWHADHIVPVYRGGGECRLENMRTLCVACHFDVTAAQHVERRSTRLKAKKKLKILMSDLWKAQGRANARITDNNLEERKRWEGVEDELLVMVPGSAYSSAACEELGHNR